MEEELDEATVRLLALGRPITRRERFGWWLSDSWWLLRRGMHHLALVALGFSIVVACMCLVLVFS